MKVLLLSLGLHILADFTLQGLFGDLKSRTWWGRMFDQLHLDNARRSLYRYDYLCALLIHALYWSLITFAPLIWFSDLSEQAVVLLVADNTVVHALVDHSKANTGAINLWIDQAFHFMQIGATFGILKVLEVAGW